MQGFERRAGASRSRGSRGSKKLKFIQMNEARIRSCRYLLCCLAGPVLLITAFLIWPGGPKEPVYRGKALTQWISEANDVGIFEQTDETKAAMTAFGTNAVPFLLKEFTRPISHTRGGLYAWVNTYAPLGIHFRTDQERVRLAGEGLMLLETNAAPALPVLVRYVNDSTRGGFVMNIIYSLGDAALPCLTAQLGSTNATAITNILEIVQRLGHNSVPAGGALPPR
jgi:hypothetical protein